MNLFLCLYFGFISHVRFMQHLRHQPEHERPFLGGVVRPRRGEELALPLRGRAEGVFVVQDGRWDGRLGTRCLVRRCLGCLRCSLGILAQLETKEAMESGGKWKWGIVLGFVLCPFAFVLPSGHARGRAWVTTVGVKGGSKRS